MTIAVGAHVATPASGSTPSAAITTTGGSGSILFILVGWYNAVNCTGVTGTIGGVADGNTYTQVGATVNSASDANLRCALFKCENFNGGATHVLTPAYSGAVLVSAVYVTNVTGAATSSPIDQAPAGAVNTHSDATAYVTPTTGATTQARELVLAWINTFTNGAGPETHTWNNSFTGIDSLTSTTTWTGANGWKLVTSTGTQQGSLTASGATATDAIGFIVTIKEGGGPSISVQPSDAHVPIGATPTLSVTAAASGGGALTYQFKKNGVNVSGGSGGSGSGTTANYTLPAVALGDDLASFTCDFTETGGSNDGTTTSAAATLRVGVLLIASSAAVYTATGTPTTIAPTWPTTAIPAGSVGKMVLVLGAKPATSGAGTVTTPSGWTLLGSITAAGGYTGGGASAADTGNCDLYVYAIDDPGTVTGSLSVTLSVGATNGVAWARMQRYAGPSGSTFSLALATGSDTSAGNVSITFGSDPGVALGDRVLAAMCVPTDVTTPAQFSAESITQTGVTYGTVTELEEPDTGNNFDIGGFLVDTIATAGPSSAAPTLTATAGGTTTNVRGPGVFVRIRAASGGTNTPMTISVTQTQTPSRARGLGLARNVNQTQTPSRLRALGRILSATQTQTTGSAPVTTGIGQNFSVTETQTPSRARVVGAGKSVTNTQTPSRTRAVGTGAKSATSAQTPSLVKGQGYLRLISGVVTQTPSITKGQGYLKALSATVTQAATRLREVGTTKTATDTQTPAAPGRALARGLSAVATQAATRARAVARTLAATDTQTPSVDVQQSGGGNHPMTLSAAVTQTVAMGRAVGRALATAQAQTPSRTRAVTPGAKAATAAQTPSLIKGSGFFKTVSATVLQTASRARAVAVTRAATETATASMARGIVATKATTQTQQSSVARSIPRTPPTATQTQTPSMVKGQGYFKTVSAVVTQTATRARELGVVRLAAVAQAPVVQRLLGRLLSALVTLTGTQTNDGFSKFVPIPPNSRGSARVATAPLARRRRTAYAPRRGR